MIFNHDAANLCLIDLDLFQEANVNLIFDIKSANPMVKIIGFSKKCNIECINQFLGAGGDGFILDSESQSRFQEKKGMNFIGENYAFNDFINNLSPLMSSDFRGLKYNNDMSNQDKSVLTKRENQVLKLTAEGYPAKVVANDLGISIFTVNQHMRAIYRKLGVTNRMQAVRIARILGEI